MSSGGGLLSQVLNRAEFRWRLLKLLAQVSVLGMLACGLTLLLVMAVNSGWINTRAAFLTALGLLGAGAFVGFLMILVRTVARSPARSWLAASIERVDRRLLDRLNALLFLESRDSRKDRCFSSRIERQVETLDPARQTGRALPASTALAAGAVFLVVALGTAWFYRQSAPLARLAVRAELDLAKADVVPGPLELPPAKSDDETRPPWGQVRITEPGKDLKLTKIDVVPLQIEAAANEPLADLGWATAVNGSEEMVRPLPLPPDRKVGVYDPTLYLDELELADWDVLTYYASAKTGTGANYGSEVYFIEVRPFREDIMKLPGGEGGESYQRLNEFTSLVERQQNVIRETYAYRQQPPSQEKSRVETREKLAATETDLSTAARHLYAGMAANLGHSSIGEALDNLAKAETALAAAAGHLNRNALPEAITEERGALAALVAARKNFHRAISEDAMGGSEGPNSEEQPPVADSAEELKQMAEFRNEAKAAQELVDHTLAQQKALEKDASALHANRPELAGRQRELQRRLEDFRSQHPQAFREAKGSAEEALESMANAAHQLDRARSGRTDEVAEATRKLEQFSGELHQAGAMQQLADAHKLQQILREKAAQFEESTKPNSAVPPDQVRDGAQESRSALDELARMAEQEPTRGLFKDPLREELSGEKKATLAQALRQLQAPATEAERMQSARQAAAGLHAVNQAFERSLPDSLQAARQEDRLKPRQDDSFKQGLAELENLLKQLQRQNPPSTEDQAKQGRQALMNLQTGMRGSGSNSGGNQALERLKKMLEAEGLDPGDLRRLLEDLAMFARENGRDGETEDSELANFDPEKVPAAYRSRIQRYFQKLSEK